MRVPVTTKFNVMTETALYYQPLNINVDMQNKQDQTCVCQRIVATNIA